MPAGSAIRGLALLNGMTGRLNCPQVAVELSNGAAMEDEIVGLDFPPLLGPATVELMGRPTCSAVFAAHDLAFNRYPIRQVKSGSSPPSSVGL
jgi:hypothetical protein